MDQIKKLVFDKINESRRQYTFESKEIYEYYNRLIFEILKLDHKAYTIMYLDKNVVAYPLVTSINTARFKQGISMDDEIFICANSIPHIKCNKLISTSSTNIENISTEINTGKINTQSTYNKRNNVIGISVSHISPVTGKIIELDKYIDYIIPANLILHVDLSLSMTNINTTLASLINTKKDGEYLLNHVDIISFDLYPFNGLNISCCIISQKLISDYEIAKSLDKYRITSIDLVVGLFETLKILNKNVSWGKTQTVFRNQIFQIHQKDNKYIKSPMYNLYDISQIENMSKLNSICIDVNYPLPILQFTDDKYVKPLREYLIQLSENTYFVKPIIG